jgi:hypothetical protein
VQSLIYGTVRRIGPGGLFALGADPNGLHHIQPADDSSTGGTQHRYMKVSRADRFSDRSRWTYYLTYHRYATDRQLRTCYPEFDAWLKEKLQFDPETKFWSDWLGHANPMACG